MATLLAGLLLVVCPQLAWCLCYLADEYQGVFMGVLPPVNGATTGKVAEVMVVGDGIPLWGECYRKMGNSILFRERGSAPCFRCMVILLRSTNVLQVYTEGLQQCFKDEESARVTCPTETSIANKQVKEIMLYKKPNPEIVVLQSYCPINGRFRFTYASNTAERMCTDPASEFSNCPYGFLLDVKFRQCTFPDEVMHYQCLGDWDGPNNERYLALLEGEANKHSPNSIPKYRCALYREDKLTGEIKVALSPDSTCTNNKLVNASAGSETFVLKPANPARWPSHVQQAECKFPEWSQGTWTYLSINGSILTFKDHRTFKTYTIKCMGKDNKSHQDRFRVFSRSHCGDEVYTCITLAQRSNHILEFQMGEFRSVQYNDSICDFEQFNPKSWITLGRRGMLKDMPCPIAGEFSGMIPDAPGLCAKLSSDCNNPDIMFYTVSNCQNRSEVFDEREYKCLGQWTEEGLTYTYTERRDVNGYQCFVGKILDNNEISIMEADVNCMRGIDLDKFGMRMSKQADCDLGLGGMSAHPTVASSVPVTRTTSTSFTSTSLSTTKTRPKSTLSDRPKVPVPTRKTTPDSPHPPPSHGDGVMSCQPMRLLVLTLATLVAASIAV